jgi:predicted esterase
MAHRTCWLGVALVALGGCGSSSAGPDTGLDAGGDRGALDGPAVVGDRGPGSEQRPPDGTPVTPKLCGLKIGTGDDVAAGANTLAIGGAQRSFLVLRINVPAGHTAKLPVVFAYHGYGSKAENFHGGSWAAASNFPHLKIVPQALNASALPVWDFQTDPKASKDLAFFDEILTCTDVAVDLERVHLVGSSMGGIFAAYVFTHRGERVASFALNSGGFVTPWSYCTWASAQLVAALTNRAPALVIWGGPSDVATWDFDKAAKATIQTLRGSNHVVIQCNHGLGHEWSDELNPFLYRFFEDHPRGMKPEPYAGGLPTTAKWGPWPSFCSIAP